MRVVIAPDKFKGSLSAPDVARHLAAGLQAATGSNLDILLIPVADGGEGTLDAAVGSGFTRRSASVSGPTGDPLTADFAVRGREAVIEMAAASGLAVLPGGAGEGGRPDSASATGATSLGTGELIRAALDAGCRQIILGVGGSANTDGGAGVLQGLGARLLDADGNELPPAAPPSPGWTGSTSPASTPGWTTPASSWPATSTTRCSAPKAPRRSSARRRAPPRRTWQHSTPRWPTLWTFSRPRSGPAR